MKDRLLPKPLALVEYNLARVDYVKDPFCHLSVKVDMVNLDRLGKKHIIDHFNLMKKDIENKLNVFSFVFSKKLPIKYMEDSRLKGSIKGYLDGLIKELPVTIAPNVRVFEKKGRIIPQKVEMKKETGFGIR